MTPFAFYVFICMEQAKKKLPEKNLIFQMVEDVCLARWEKMSDFHKKRFVTMSELDEARFDKEMKKYKTKNTVNADEEKKAEKEKEETQSGIGGGRNSNSGGQKRKRKEIPGEQRKSARLSLEPGDKEISKAQQIKKPTSRKRSASKDPNVGVLMPENITEEMLNQVADRSGQKIYNREVGTSCHQCRQKTLDMKTVCRSGRCVGGRGQFCGRCLVLRYGEDAREALMDPGWCCPPCRNICNCSLCRNKKGKGATGILINQAKSKGFSNVADYLKDLTEKKGK